MYTGSRIKRIEIHSANSCFKRMFKLIRERIRSITQIELIKGQVSSNKTLLY